MEMSYKYTSLKIPSQTSISMGCWCWYMWAHRFWSHCQNFLHSFSGFIAAADLGMLCTVLSFWFLWIELYLVGRSVNDGYGMGMFACIVYWNFYWNSAWGTSLDSPFLYISYSCMVLIQLCIFFFFSSKVESISRISASNVSLNTRWWQDWG